MVSVVVPCFNGGKRLVANLQKLRGMLEKSKLEHEIIVVDDASTEKIDWPGMIENAKNLGFGATVDRGIRKARGEIVFVLNATDLLPEKADYFKIILAHFKNEKVFSVGALKRDSEDHGSGEIYFEKGLFLHRRGTGGRFTSWADGGAQVLRRDYYLRIGGFDPLYKFYWEDVDLGYRAWKAGYEVLFDPKAVLLHEKAEGPIARVYPERSRRVMNYRNQMVFTYKNADLKHLFLHCLWWPYHLAVALKNGDWAWFEGYFQAVFALPMVLSSRFRQRMVTELTDDQVLRVFQKS